MTEDGTINGAKVAAQILGHLPETARNRLRKSIGRVNPKALAKIEQNLFTFDDLSELSIQSVQVLIQSIEHKDLVAALKGAKEDVILHLLSNISQRKSQIVREDLLALPSLPAKEIETAKLRIMKKVDQLRTAGAIRTERDEDAWV